MVTLYYIISLPTPLGCCIVTSCIPRAFHMATKERAGRAERLSLGYGGHVAAPFCCVILGSSYNMGESFFFGFSGSTGLGGFGKGMLPWVLLVGEDRKFIKSNGKGKTTVEGFSVDKDWRVWRYRSWTAAGVPDRISAAIRRDSEAAFSPSAAIIWRTDMKKSTVISPLRPTKVLITVHVTHQTSSENLLCMWQALLSTE